MRRLALLPYAVAALLGAGVAEVSAAANLEVGASVTVASDYLLRGVSQTRDRPAVQAVVAVEHASGWFGSLFASSVDFDGPPDVYPPDVYPPDLYGTTDGDDRNVEVDLRVGYGRDLGRGWGLVGSGVRYEYPNADRSYGYTEVGLGLEYHGVTASLGVTDEARGYQGSARIWEVVARRPLPRQITLNAGAGWYELTRLDDDYVFWHLALLRSFDRVAIELGYYGSDADGRRLYGERADGRLVLGASFRLR